MENYIKPNVFQMLQVCTVQYGSHMWVLSTWNVLIQIEMCSKYKIHPRILRLNMKKIVKYPAKNWKGNILDILSYILIF